MPVSLALPVGIANLLLITGALVASRRELWAFVPRSRNGRSALFLVLLIAFSVRVLNPYRPILIDDELFYHEQSTVLAQHHINAFCTLGMSGDCQRFDTFFPIGYPLILSLTSTLFGFSDLAARVVGVVGGVLTVGCVYLLVTLVGRDRRVALVAALVIALLPMHVRYAVTTRSEVSSILLETLAVLAAIVHVRTRRAALGWLSAACTAFLLTMRVESVLIIVPLIVVYRRWSDYPRPSLTPWIVALVLIAPTYMSWSELHFGYQGISQRLDLSQVVGNVSYVFYWFDGFHQPFLFTALAMMGCVVMWRLPSPYGTLAASWWVVRLFVYLLQTSETFIPRYMLLLSAPFAMACGAGARALAPRSHVLIGAIILSGAFHLPFAYDTWYGFELPEAMGRSLGVLHLVLPLTVLLWALWRVGEGGRRLLVVVTISCIVLVPCLYKTITTNDGVHRPIRETLAWEARIIDGWRTLVGPECYILAVESIRPQHMWRRRVIVVDTEPKRFPRELMAATIRKDVRALLDKGSCVYLYGSDRDRNILTPALDSSFKIVPIQRVTAPGGEMSALFTDLQLSRIELVGKAD